MFGFNAQTQSWVSRRTVGDGLVGNPMGVHVDVNGNLYVCNWIGRKLLIFNSEDQMIHELAMPGRPRDVLVTRTGAVVISLDDPDSIIIFPAPS